MTVGPGNAQRQWRATTIYDDVPLAAKLSPVGGIAACFLASPWAGYAREALNKSTSDQRRANPPTPIRQWGFGE
jgi:hypothetical protein